ncbi:MAG: hypothetical protein ACI4EI_10510 [Muricoprocola sp.]
MKKKRSLLCMVIGGCLLFGSVSGAYWSLAGSSGNLVTIGTYQNQIVEEYREPGQVHPGQTVEKKVSVSNTGSVDTLIRVQIQKMFGTEEKDGTFIEDKTLDPEMIQISCDTEYWTKKGDYYYYNQVLKAGEITRKPLFEQYVLSDKAGNEYMDKAARIIVTMESVQAEGNALQIWDTSYKELGITALELPQAEKSIVEYRGQNAGFAISEATTDLFVSFKNLVPGCSRAQSILIKNNSAESAELFLRAEEAKQIFTNTSQKGRILELLEKKAQIRISQGSRVIYQGPLSGNLEAQTGTLKKDISLGTFEAKEEKMLTVLLALSPDMDGEYEKLTGKVRWVFTAKGEGGTGVTTVSSDVPVTGDAAHLAMWTALFLTSFLFFLAAYLIEKREQRREEENEADRRNF